MAKKYGKAAEESVEQAMHERKHGQLRMGRSNKKVTSRKQAVAIGLSEARKKGAKVPPPPKASATAKNRPAKKRAARTRKQSSGKRSSR